jgi:hypothetical protein
LNMGAWLLVIHGVYIESEDPNERKTYSPSPFTLFHP